VAGQASGGQTLTPNRNVSAPAGFGGDKWGAFGGGIAPVGTVRTVKQTLSNAQTGADYIFDANNQVVMGGLSNGAVSGVTTDSTADDSLADTWTADQQSPGVADSQI
jgi:hypothetical protein